MTNAKNGLGWTDMCCLCGREVVSYHNPDPLRDGRENCCDACNRLVVEARRQIFFMPEEERKTYAQRLRKTPYEGLCTLLKTPEWQAAMKE